MEFEFLLVTVLMVILAVGAYRQLARARRWGAIAREFGLDYTKANLFSSPRISGHSDGVMADIRLVNQNKTAYIQIVVEYPQAPTSFRITRATEIGNALRGSVLGHLVEAVAGEDVELGFDAFDELARIDGERDELRPYLNLERRNAITYLLENFTSTRVTDKEIRIRLKSRDPQGDRLRHGLSQAIAAGRLMRPSTRPSEERGTPAPRPAMTETETPPEDVWAAAHALPVTPPTPRPVQTHASRRPAHGAIIAGHIDAEVMAEELFASGAVSYAAERVFREHYQGMLISWRGYVLRVDAHETVVKVGEIDDPLFGHSDVVASIDTVPGPDVMERDYVTVDGVATDMNHLERTIYIGDASVTHA